MGKYKFSNGSELHTTEITVVTTEGNTKSHSFGWEATLLATSEGRVHSFLGIGWGTTEKDAVIEAIRCRAATVAEL